MIQYCTVLVLSLCGLTSGGGNQLGLCHYLKLIGRRSAFCGDPPEVNTVDVFRKTSPTNRGTSKFGIYTPKDYSSEDHDYTIFNPIVHPHVNTRHVSIEKYRQLLLESKPRHVPTTTRYPEMKRTKPVFPLPSSYPYAADLQPVAMRSLGVCKSRYSSCSSSPFCSSSVLCRDTEGLCCRPEQSVLLDSPAPSCPAPQVLTPKCAKKLGVSWCERDTDCHTVIERRRCCPTACGYNVCV